MLSVITEVTVQDGVHGLYDAGEGGHQQQLILLGGAHHVEDQVLFGIGSDVRNAQKMRSRVGQIEIYDGITLL